MENNIAPNTQIGRIDISNIWKVRIGKGTFYLKDSGVAHDYPMTEIDNKKTPKMVEVYLDKDLTKPALDGDGNIIKVPANLDQMETLEYTKFNSLENPYGNDKYSRSGGFIEDLVTENIVQFCHTWMKLADVKEFLVDWNEYNYHYLTSYSSHNTYQRFNYIQEDHKVVENPFIDMGQVKTINPFYQTDCEHPVLNLSPYNNEVNLDDYESKFRGYNPDN